MAVGEIKEYYVKVGPAYRSMKWSGEFGTAYVSFIPEGEKLPKNRKHSSSTFVAYYYHEEWSLLLDLLRNESPVIFSFSESKNYVAIYTDSEPVGEGEW